MLFWPLGPSVSTHTHIYLHTHPGTHKYSYKEAITHILLNCCHVITLMSLGSARHEWTLLNYGL